MNSLQFLDALKKRYATDDLTLSRLLKLIRDCGDEGSIILDPTRAIVHIAEALKKAPRLFYGLNAVLRQGYAIECHLDAGQLHHFLLIKPEISQIYSISSLNVLIQSSAPEPYTSTVSLRDCESFINSKSDPGWLICWAQLLQHEMDDPNIHPSYWRYNFKFLKMIAKKGILPPSIFVNDITCEGGPISGGTFADVYKGRFKEKSVCLKVLRIFSKPPGHREKVYKEFSREVLVWNQLAHPNILAFIGANKKLFSQRFCLVSPWMSRGNIIDYLKTHHDHDRLTSLCEIVEGISYLHNLDPPVTHKDIKGANILVNEDHVCCLADFGLASIVELQTQQLGSSAPLTGSFCWMAPEVMQPKLFPDQGPGLPGDIYALACTIFEIYTSKPPFADRTNGATVIHAVLAKQRPRLPPKPGHWTTQEDDIWKLVRDCWKHEPSDRPDIEFIKKNLQAIRRSLCLEQISRQNSLVSPSEHFVSPWTVSGSSDSNVKEWLDKEISAIETCRQEFWNTAVITMPNTPRPGSQMRIVGSRTPRPEKPQKIQTQLESMPLLISRSFSDPLKARYSI